MGSSTSKGCQRRIKTILRPGHGFPYQAQISVCTTGLLAINVVLIHRRQVGQTSEGEVKKRDLRADLIVAEQEARNKKRKAEGKPPLPVEGGSSSGATAVDEEANKRRKLLQEALEMDKDDDDEDEDEEGEKKANGHQDEDEEYVAQCTFSPLVHSLAIEQ